MAAGIRVTMALMESVAGESLLLIAGHTFAEYRDGKRTTREAQLVKMWRPEVIRIDAAEGRRAGELLGLAGGGGTMDALVVAVADLHRIDEIFTTDPIDISRFCLARNESGRHITVVSVQ